MTAPNRYSGYTASFISSGPTTTHLAQLSGHAVDANQKEIDLRASGALDRLAVMLGSAQAACRITTEDLLVALGLVDPAVGLSCTGGAVFRLQQRATSAAFASGSAHHLVTSTAGFLCPETLSASADNPAQLGLMYYPFSSDGITDPLIATYNQAIGGTTPAYSSQYFLGGVYLGSSPLLSCVSVQLNFGIKFSLFTTRGASDGNLYPLAGSIISRAPSVTLGFTAADLVPSTLSSLFNNSVSSTLKLYFARAVPGGTRAAYNGSNHVKISIANGAWNARAISVAGENDSELTIPVKPTGTIAMSVASTIP